MNLFQRAIGGIFAVALFGLSLSAGAATITIVNLDGANEGFNDPTPVAPEGGNPGTTRGQQRLNLFQAAANVWAAKLQSNQTIKVGANFDPLSPCTSSGGVLGSAGPTSLLKLTAPPAGYQANTWYSIAEAEAVQNANLNGSGNEISAQFNSSVDNGCLGAGSRWWYGTTSPSPSGALISLFPVVLHELGHGLGFISLVCVQPGGCGGGTQQGSLASGSQDIWNFFLKSSSTGKLWKDMSDAERAVSMTNNQHLVWDGANVTAAIPTFQPGHSGVDPATQRLKMYAPNPVEPGSSVSHWDTTAAAPNLLMEPALQDEFNGTDMTVPLFQDIGWPMASGAVNQAPTLSLPASISVSEDTLSALTGVSFADVDAGSGSVTATFSAGAGTLSATGSGGVTVGGSATSLTLSGTIANINAFVAAGHVGYTSALNAMGNLTLTVQINDNGNTGSGGAKTASNTTNLAIAAVNDAPTLSAPASIAVTEDVATSLAGLSFGDVDAGAASVSVSLGVSAGTLSATSGAGVTVSGSASSLTLSGSVANINSFVAAGNVRYTTVANATGNVALTVSINDNGNTGSGGAKLASGSVTLTVAAVNDAPTLAAPSAIAVAAPGTTRVAGISIADVDAGAANLTLTLNTTAGSLSAVSAGGVTAAGSGTATLTLTGSLANLNAYLGGTNLNFVATGALPGSAATLTVTINDNGNSGSGGAKTASRSVTLSAGIIFANDFE